MQLTYGWDVVDLKPWGRSYFVCSPPHVVFFGSVGDGNAMPLMESDLMCWGSIKGIAIAELICFRVRCSPDQSPPVLWQQALLPKVLRQQLQWAHKTSCAALGLSLLCIGLLPAPNLPPTCKLATSPYQSPDLHHLFGLAICNAIHKFYRLWIVLVPWHARTISWSQKEIVSRRLGGRCETWHHKTWAQLAFPCK